MVEKALPRGVILIDGVHTVDNTIDGIKKLATEIGFRPVRCVWIGGTEKIKSPDSFRAAFKEALGVEVVMSGDPENGVADPLDGLRRALEKRDIDIVVQLSGSPQVNRTITNRFASLAVGFGASYVAGGTVFAEKGSDLKADKPSIGLYATDKRVGKTAFGNYMARLIGGMMDTPTPWTPIIMTHSRGGPPVPPVLHIYRKINDGRPAAELEPEEMFSRRFQPEFLEKLLDFGLHGASDVFEDALIISQYLDHFEARTGSAAKQVCVVGCRRAGAGYFHEFAVSNVDLGLEKAAECPGNYIIHEGSGGEHPPVKVDATITLVPTDTDTRLLRDFPGLDATDLFILAHCQPETATAEVIAGVESALRERNPTAPVIRTLFEPELLSASPPRRKS